ncbi:MAG: ABC transporter permease subunit [Planctomycetota bacterium]
MIAALLPIARNAFVESVRQPVFLVVVLVAGLLQLINVWVSGFTMGYRNVPGEVTADDKLLLDVSLATVFLCGMVLAAFIATSTISREIENKTILTVVSKPIGRTTVILGKWLGVSGAMLVAILIMVGFLMHGIRHGVMSTAADHFDQPVIVFGIGGLVLCLLLGAVANYLYSWSFSQTSALLIAPVIWTAYVVALFFGKEWELQPPTTDLKPQIMLACMCLGVALLVMTAIAIAASTRLGQVMTIIACLVFFLVGLLSNYIVGRHVYSNTRVGQIAYADLISTPDTFLHDFHRDKTVPLAAERAGVDPEVFEDEGYLVETYVEPREILRMGPVDSEVWRELMLQEPGSEYRIELLGPPRRAINVGDSVWYGASPNGVSLAVAPYAPLPAEAATSGVPSDQPGLVVTFINDLSVFVKQVGREAVPVERPPMARDSLFLQTTEINPAWLGLWGLVPNMQSFWLLDAITQNQPIPFPHVARILVYGVFQIVIFLSLAVLLFQGRDVG